MSGTPKTRNVVLALLFLLCPMAWGQVVTLTDAIEGKSPPSSVKPADLPADYRAVEIKVGSSTTYMETMMPFLGMSMGGGGGTSDRDQKMMLLVSLLDVYWTAGKTVKLQLAGPDPSGTTPATQADYLVAYKLDMGIMDLARMGSDESASASLMLKLVLIRTDQIASLSPRPKIDRSVLLSLNQTAQEVASEMPGATMAAKQAQTLSNVKQMCLATIMYASDWDDVLPYAQSTSAVRFVTQPYCKNYEIFKTSNPNGGEIRFNMAVAGVEIPPINVSGTILFFESTPWPDGARIVGYVDGHAKKLDPTEWERESASLKLKLPRKTKPLPPDWGVREDPLKNQGAPMTPPAVHSPR